MPNPKRKHTRSRRDSRRSANWKLEAISSSTCTNCKSIRPPHRVCPSCGFYNGKLVNPPKSKSKTSGPEAGEQKD